MTFYEIIILDYGKQGERTKLIIESKRSKALKIYDKYLKRYRNIRVQKVVTTWVR